MATKPCEDGDGLRKRPGHPKWCEESWLRRQSIGVREKAARERLELIPEELRRRVCPERLWPEGRRWCSGCQTFVLLVDVPASGSRCRTCLSIGTHSTHIASEYGMTREEYEALWELQGGRCAICRCELHSRRPALDHDHKTGERRGLLCADNEWGCNHKILAKIDTDPSPIAMAQRIVDYLINPPARRVQVKPR